MKVGNLKSYCFVLLFNCALVNLHGEEQINLNILQPTFEEEIETTEDQTEDSLTIKSKRKQPSLKDESIVKFKALDKITAKTKNINITIGEKKRFGYLEIYPKKCNRFEDRDNKGVAVYIQVRDLSDEKEDKIFVFNGWTFSTSTNLKTFDHPIYDLWVTGCENI